MACFRGIEHMPSDALREIMIRVAGQPKGAADIARAFTVSKSLRNFAEDEDVLRAVSFNDLFPCLAGRHELLFEVGGLVVRCSRAGNSDAQFILSKVVLVSASMLSNAKMETAHSNASLDQYYNLRDLLKATHLLDHLSAQNTNPTELFGLVRNFLSRARPRDFVEMQRHLRSFVALYVVTEKKPQHQEFLTTLEKSCEKKSFPLAFSSDPLAYLIRHLNELCKTAQCWMNEMGIDEEVLHPLLQCTVEMNDDVGYETVMERLDVIEPVLKIGGNMASTASDPLVLITNRGILCLAAMLRRQLKQLMNYEAVFQSRRGLLLASFDALFDIQQAVIATKVMARVRGIEQLPKDDLREIMIHVARQPGGAVDIARAFAVCKTFGDFVEDRMVLEAVCFKNLFSQLPKRYDLFADADGLVARCARVGNLDALFILAKIVMVSASKLCNSNMQLMQREGFVKLADQHLPLNLRDVDKAEHLLDQFSAQNRDPTELFRLIRNFLSRARARDLVEMHDHLNNFIALYLIPGKTRQYQQLIALLDKLCRHSILVMTTSDQLTSIAEKFKVTCTAAYKVLKRVGIEEAQFHPLIQCLEQMTDDVEYETVAECLKIAFPIFKLGSEVASNLKNGQAFLTMRESSLRTAILTGQLRQLMAHEAFLNSNRGSLLASFDAVYSV
ncbi:hypothetical protein RND81_02G036900 [Saponaria officinalis]|uniref:Uncharacterized protein n=1 Tax=Saponaria officinalis TaxID=3572 RepID=A0AAW1MMY9_SAPOF